MPGTGDLVGCSDELVGGGGEPADGVEAVVARVFREEWGQVVATLIRVTGDWELAEECAQEAFAAALERWPRDGVPRKPGAWLTTTARHRAVDRIRREAVGAAKLREVAVMAEDVVPAPFEEQDDVVPDDLLRLMFTCCHPALGLEARVALTLRTLAGLSTAEIARAFLVPEQTMQKRIGRAKQKIKNAAIPYRVPPAQLLPDRTPAVLAVLYLLFNEGYTASTGADLVRRNLTAEAIRLTQVLASLMPDEPEVSGMLALMLLHDARKAGRQDGSGQLIPLEEQDRGRWDAELISLGTEILERALRRREPGPYQIQAAIAACHATAHTADDTDWPQIAGLYAQLAGFSPTPVARLNQAVAIGMAEGPEAGLLLVDELVASGTLSDYHLLQATRADLLRRAGRLDEAATAYREALTKATTEAERSFLRRRIEETAL
ncbi:RNA polymerase sigma factor [Kribbella sp. NPDC051620]|uniref:RNA polymerase sigma factor n=1 Tax=Kribbella sp. NPDC051620 TaxID=3364120 RepID=UPI0037BD6D3F